MAAERLIRRRDKGYGGLETSYIRMQGTTEFSLGMRSSTCGGRVCFRRVTVCRRRLFLLQLLLLLCAVGSFICVSVQSKGRGGEKGSGLQGYEREGNPSCGEQTFDQHETRLHGKIVKSIYEHTSSFPRQRKVVYKHMSHLVGGETGKKAKASKMAGHKKAQKKNQASRKGSKASKHHADGKIGKREGNVKSRAPRKEGAHKGDKKMVSRKHPSKHSRKHERSKSKYGGEGRKGSKGRKRDTKDSKVMVQTTGERDRWRGSAQKDEIDRRVGGEVSRLQLDLDAFCVNYFKKLSRVERIGGVFPAVQGAVARLGPGKDPESFTMEWRCYDDRILKTREKRVFCVDECGGELRCDGRVRPNIIISEPLSELKQLMSLRRPRYCSSFQHAANALCNSKEAAHIARFDPHRSRWLCLNPMDLTLDSQGFCANNCGGIQPCAGGLPSEDAHAYTVYIVQESIAETFGALQPCKSPDETCVPTSINPPKCVGATSSLAVHNLSHQQAAMNKLCQERADRLCRIGSRDTFCFDPWLARRDANNGKHDTDWACFAEATLDFTVLATCLDGCSTEVPCPGVPTEEAYEHRLLVNEISAISRNPHYCSPYQARGNAFCEKKFGKGYVARQHATIREWTCFKKNQLPPKGWTGCADNCGLFATCSSASTEPDPYIEGERGLLNAIKNTVAPCYTGEECESTPLNPPFCSETRPNPQPPALTTEQLQSITKCLVPASILRAGLPGVSFST